MEAVLGGDEMLLPLEQQHIRLRAYFIGYLRPIRPDQIDKFHERSLWAFGLGVNADPNLSGGIYFVCKVPGGKALKPVPMETNFYSPALKAASW